MSTQTLINGAQRRTGLLSYQAMVDSPGIYESEVVFTHWIDAPGGELEVTFWFSPADWFNSEGAIPPVYYEPSDYTEAKQDEIERIIHDMYAGGGGVGLSLLTAMQKAADQYEG